MFFIVALLFVAIFVLFGGISRMTLRSYYLEMAALSKHFSGSHSTSIFSDPKFVGYFSDYKFTITYVRGNKGLSVNGLSVACNIRLSSSLKIFAYAKNPGPVLLAKRINIGDNDLDKYFIYSNQEEAMRYLSVPARRHSIKQIIDKWQMLKITGKSIYTYADIRTAPTLAPDMVRTSIKDLIDLRIDHI